MPRQKITKSAEIPDVDGLPRLNAQEQRLVEALTAGCKNTEAYRRAYGAEGYSPASLKVRACRKVAEQKIQVHLRALRAVGFANAKLTLEDRIEDELAFALRAEDAGNYGAAGQARERVNKLLGLYVNKVQDVTECGLDATLDEIAAIDPDYAQRLAELEGLTHWRPAKTRTVN